MSKFALLGLMLVAGGAMAAEAAATNADFVKLDVNKDGSIDKQEAAANAALAKTYDNVAKGGKLSEADFASWQKSSTGQAAQK
ncbi:MAG: EF-hand domain-containing protein [Gammaproteobacteria bacterium]|nr:EF-hand domain-containing protein [Gammaproteobacteria bacterium]